MAKYIEYSTEAREVVQDVLDELIVAHGKSCKLVYPPKFISCSNCLPDPIGNKSSNRWLTGGPMPFPAGSTCPMCNGAYKVATENSETITMVIYWNPSDWLWLPGNIRVADGMVQTRGMLSDLPKIKSCNEAVFQTNIQPYTTYRFRLNGDVVDYANIVQDRYFLAFWKRVG